MFLRRRAGRGLAFSAFLIVLSALLPRTGLARWATPEDAGWELVESNREIEVDSGG
jgi:hypothetical protein